jgi:hypothetical protein
MEAPALLGLLAVMAGEVVVLKGSEGRVGQSHLEQRLGGVGVEVEVGQVLRQLMGISRTRSLGQLLQLQVAAPPPGGAVVDAKAAAQQRAALAEVPSP